LSAVGVFLGGCGDAVAVNARAWGTDDRVQLYGMTNTYVSRCVTRHDAADCLFRDHLFAVIMAA
jgi:hypothetical protein